MIETFTVDNMNTMDSMNDAIVTNISIHENILEIEYDNLDIADPEGNPLYPYNKVTISYEMRRYNEHFPFCEVTVYYGKNKYKYIEIEKLIELSKKMRLESYLYRIDSFKSLTLVFDLGRPSKKYWGAEIALDPVKITYNWEGEPTYFMNNCES
ncbi:MAG: hypothetical protein K2N42_01030 [Anaeroplasmataceae bacterium]|nr:hypothetical protein [Anaeroplasmataceae bacterium]